MLWFPLILTQLGFGYAVSMFLLPVKCSIETIMGLAVPVGFGISSILFFAGSAILGITSFHLIVHMAGLAFLTFAIVKKRMPSRKSLVVLSVAIVVAFVIIRDLYLPQPHHFNVSLSGDIREEVSMIQSFYQGANSGLLNIFKIRHTACHKCVVRTRWMTAFHSAMMRTGYASLRVAMVVPSTFMLAAIVFLFFCLARYFLASDFLSGCAVFLFLSAGGFGFVHWLERSPRNNKSLDFTFNYGTGTTQWSHPLLHYLVALRHSQLTVCLMLAVLLLLTEIKVSSKKGFALMGILLGILPGSDSTVAVFAILYVGVNLGVRMLISKNCVVGIVTFVSVALIPSFQFIPRATYRPDIQDKPFYFPVVKEGKFFPVIQCWFDALGLFVVVAIVLCWFFMDKELFIFYFPSFVVFLIANNKTMFPYSRHNILVFYPLWMPMATIAVMRTLREIHDRIQDEELRGVFVGFCIVGYFSSVCSSTLGYWRLRTSTSEMWTKETEDLGNWIATNTAKKAVFVACGVDYNPVSAIAGKVLYQQNDRITWLCGYNTTGRFDQTKAFLTSPASADIPKVAYVVLTGDQCKELPLTMFSGPGWERIYRSGQNVIFSRGGNSA